MLMPTLIVDEERKHGVDFEKPPLLVRTEGFGKGGNHRLDRSEKERGIRKIAIKIEVVTYET
jgi:hypothetical protein